MSASACHDVADTWLTSFRRPRLGFVLPYVNGDVQAAQDVVPETVAPMQAIITQVVLADVSQGAPR